MWKGGFISVATGETDRAGKLKMLHCVIKLNPSEVHVYSCISALYTSISKTRITTHCSLPPRPGRHNHARYWCCVLNVYLYAFIVVRWLCAALNTHLIIDPQHKRWCPNAEVSASLLSLFAITMSTVLPTHVCTSRWLTPDKCSSRLPAQFPESQQGFFY